MAHVLTRRVCPQSQEQPVPLRQHVRHVRAACCGCARHSLQTVRLAGVGAPQDSTWAPLEAVAEEQAAAETAAKQARVSNNMPAQSVYAGSHVQCLDKLGTQHVQHMPAEAHAMLRFDHV